MIETVIADSRDAPVMDTGTVYGPLPTRISLGGLSVTRAPPAAASLRQRVALSCGWPVAGGAAGGLREASPAAGSEYPRPAPGA